MKLQTNIPLKPQKFNPIDYNSKLVLFGSCFSENIADKFSYFKFQSYKNPFGILFHPLAIETLITNAINEKNYSQSDIFFLNEQWHCFEAHSKLSTVSKDELIETLNNNSQNTFKQLKTASHVIITLGTAWAYRHIETDAHVANCHKIPQKKFLRELLSVEEISETLEAIVSLIKSINSNVQVIFTVSPVRHIKDGFVKNTLSKSHLISAIHQFRGQESSTGNRPSEYFPSYEIMMDELRDYRFYNEDMLHPNATAINYIWERFQEAWISDEAQQTITEVDIIQRGLMHRPFNANSQAHLTFLKQLEHKKTLLKSRFSHIVF